MSNTPETLQKTTLTQEQADALEWAKDNYSYENIVKISVKKLWNSNIAGKLNDVEIDKLIRALYFDDYEIEKVFKVGEWVVDREGKFGDGANIGKVIKIEDEKIYAYWNGSEIDYCIESSYLEHATQEEIEKEEQRIWWLNHGRLVWELKENDIIETQNTGEQFNVVHIFDSGDIEISDNIGRLIIHSSNVSNYYYKVVCFVEDRKDIEKDV